MNRAYTLEVITGTRKLVPYHSIKSCNPINDQLPVDEIYWYPILKYMAWCKTAVTPVH